MVLIHIRTNKANILRNTMKDIKPSLLGFECAESDDIGSKCNGKLNSRQIGSRLWPVLWIYTVSQTCVYTVTLFTKTTCVDTVLIGKGHGLHDIKGDC